MCEVGNKCDTLNCANMYHWTVRITSGRVHACKTICLNENTFCEDISVNVLYQ